MLTIKTAMAKTINMLLTNMSTVREFHQGGYPAWILTVYTGAKVAFQTIVVNGNA